MSLLMDALKQAEHAKRDKKTDAATPPRPVEAPAVAPAASAPAELSLSPAEPHQEETPAIALIAEPESPAAESAAPESTATDAWDIAESDSAPDIQVDAETEHTAAPQPVLAEADAQDESAPTLVTLETTPPSNRDGAQDAARVLAASEARLASRGRRTTLGLIALSVVLIVALVGYYYWASLSQNKPYMGLPQLPVELDAEATADAADIGPNALEESSLPTQTAWQNGTAPVVPAAQDWQPAPVDPRVLRGEQPAVTAEPEPASSAAPARAEIRVSRTTQPSSINNLLHTAYSDYQAGRWQAAERGYRKVLSSDGNNRDARLGLAALALRAGNVETARAHYLELVRRNPKDLSAQAALAGLEENRSPSTESELKTLVAESPQSAQLHFALANIYAEQNRWALAQQAYFEAQRINPTNPDYAFNLAVSLEHLERPQLALDYYRRALALTERQAPQFDLTTAQQRVRTLAVQTSP